MRHRPWIIRPATALLPLLVSFGAHATEILTVSGTLPYVYSGKPNAIPFPVAVSPGDPYTATFELEDSPGPGESQIGSAAASYWTVTHVSVEVAGQVFSYTPATENTGTFLQRGDVGVLMRPAGTGLPYPIDVWQLDAYSKAPLDAGSPGYFMTELAFFAPGGTIRSLDYFLPQQSEWPTLAGINNRIFFGACDTDCNSFGGPVEAWSVQPVHQVPEPDSVWLLLAGFVGFGMILTVRRRDLTKAAAVG